MKGFCKYGLLSTLAVATCFYTETAQAQDARFSQYYSAPLRLNPAMIGMYEGNMRVGVNYRSQWGSVLGRPYTTYALTADAKIPTFSKDYIGVGMSAMRDISGSSGYNQTELNVGLAYQKRLSKTRRRYGRNKQESFLSAGAQVGFGQRGIKWDELSFSQQYNPDNNSYEQSWYSGETNNVRANKTYADINAGVMWAGTFGNRKTAYVGLGIHHINRPDISLFNRAPLDSAGNPIGTGVEKLYTRWAVHAGGEVLVGGRNSSISLLPGFVGMFQGPSMETNFGLSVRFQGQKFDDFAFRMGAWMRLANQFIGQSATKISPDAMIWLVGIDYQTFQFMFSYDATLSSLRPQVNGRGSLEFSLFYRYDGDEKRGQGCPTNF